jgi:hypothetical protein
MTMSLIVVVAGCLYAMAFIPAAVSAASGQIAFSGAIVEPTCNAPPVEVTMAAYAPGTETRARRLACGKLDHAAAGASQRYVLTTEHLSSSVSDRVLKYFDAYVKASQPHAADPVLLTQTYE